MCVIIYVQIFVMLFYVALIYLDFLFSHFSISTVSCKATFLISLSWFYLEISSVNSSNFVKCIFTNFLNYISL